ncbi:MAG: hypothetical protein GY832_34140 [Chloroflexi bacterium]|nr:hypothetical protein [Chloroflexota bacterium]
MSRESKFLIAILIVLTASVLVTGVSVVYLAATRRQVDVNLANANPVEPTEDLLLLMTPTTPVVESYIAYATDRTDDDYQTAIYVLDVGGGEPDYVNSRYIGGSEGGTCILPSWSPGGDKIAYLLQAPGEEGGLDDDDYRMEVWVAALDGSEQISVSDVISEELDSYWTIVAWSPDGTQLAFMAQVVEDDDPTLYVVQADGSEVDHRISLEWNVSRVFWSPTGDELLFVPDIGGARIVYLEDERIVEVYEDVRTVASWETAMDWSSDGTEFVVSYHMIQEVLIVGIDGELHWSIEMSDGYPSEVAWSPDGAYIAVSVAPAPQENADTLHIIEIETGQLTAAFYDQNRSIFLPDWSPDGNRVLFSTISDRQPEVPNPIGWPASTLWIYDVASGDLEQLTPGEVHDGMGAWSPLN